jgi:hypothetical protein
MGEHVFRLGGFSCHPLMKSPAVSKIKRGGFDPATKDLHFLPAEQKNRRRPDAIV